MSVTGADFEARRGAEKAKQRMDDHEKYCAERYNSIGVAIMRMEQKIDGLGTQIANRLWWAAGLVLTGMGAIILMLVEKAH